MTLRSRVSALERKAGIVGPCRVCGGHGSIASVSYIQGETPPEPEGCPECGRVGHVKVVITDGTREEDYQ
jgi:hypothetical protein